MEQKKEPDLAINIKQLGVDINLSGRTNSWNQGTNTWELTNMKQEHG